MKKVITTVGTSLFTNYLDKNKDIKNHYEQVKEKPFEAYERSLERIKRISPPVLDFACKEDNASAEFKSILKMKEELKDSLDVFLLASDSITSVLAAEIIKGAFEKRKDKEIRINFNKQLDVIKGLKIDNQDEFSKEGMPNLIKRIYGLADEGYFGNVILNITGGYKATIPFLTVLGQVNNVPLYYIFEDTQSLIKIPQTPVDIDWKTIEQYQNVLERLEREGAIEVNRIFPETIEALLERADNYVELNSLGVIFWERYKARFYLFHLFPEEYEKYMRQNKSDRQLTNKSLKELKRRLDSNPEHPDLYHGLKNCNLSEGFHCFKHEEDKMQVRILWHAKGRKSSYGAIINDIYIAMILTGDEVHNSESEYVGTFNSFSKKYGSKLDLKNFHVISIPKEEAGHV